MRPVQFRRAQRLVVLLCLLAGVAQAQPAAGWQAFPAYNEVTALATDGTSIWSGTPAGVFRYTPSTGEISRFSPVDGLRGGPLRTMEFDRRRGALWIGYADGGMDRLDAATGDVTRIEDIARATQFPSRGIRRIRVQGDSLYLATDFGVVVFDAVQARVRNSYTRLGTLPAATAVNDVLQAPLPDGTPGLWAAAATALVRAPLGSELQTPAPWQVEPSFQFPSFALATLNGTLYVNGGLVGARDIYRRTATGAWERLVFTDQVFAPLRSVGDRLIGVSRSNLLVLRPDLSAASVGSPQFSSLQDAVSTDDGQLWVGDAALGLFQTDPDPPNGSSTVTPSPIVPSGPYTNQIEDLAIARDGTVWISTRYLIGTSTAAVGRYDGSTWTNYLSSDPTLSISRSEFRGATVDDDGRFYVGTEGLQTSTEEGLTVFTDGQPTLYNVDNSTLRGITSDPRYVVVRDIAIEEGRRWVINNAAERQLHLFDADGTWTGLPTPSGINPSANFSRLVVDSFGQKWIALIADGLAVWDTGADPADPADDRGRQYSGEGGGGQGLPSARVNAVAVDGDGRVWLGTDRGIAYIFSPGAAFGNDPSLATPQWPIVVGADGGGEANYLLRDVRVTDLSTDPSGRIWVASSSGAYLLNADGNDIERQITSANSPLPSDVVLRIDVDPVSGRVYLVTPTGLFSTDGDATRPQAGSEALTVAPNPFRPETHADGILITGLNAAQSQVRILTVDGEVVHARDALGGSFRWDGRDDRTGEPVPSGIYIVAAASETGQTVYGKVAVIR